MKILITGSSGFIGKNLAFFLKSNNHKVFLFDKKKTTADLINYIKKADFIFHLAGVNRPKSNKDYENNYNFTKFLLDTILDLNKKVPIVFTSSTKAIQKNSYGNSKIKAEKLLKKFSKENNSPVVIYRLPNIFGKWSKPNYNSVVATFCYNAVNNIDLNIKNNQKLELVYIDDLMNAFIEILKVNFNSKFKYEKLKKSYTITVKNLAEKILSFRGKDNLVQDVGQGIDRDLYATYLSFLRPKDFSIKVESKKDKRGIFVEMLKTKSSGQISFFTAKPGVTRGQHFHHTKNEQFLVVKGKATFKFFSLNSKEKYQIKVNSKNPKIVQSIPGWAHDITNHGDEEMIVLLWSNEVFNECIPDTYEYKIE